MKEIWMHTKKDVPEHESPHQMKCLEKGRSKQYRGYLSYSKQQTPTYVGEGKPRHAKNKYFYIIVISHVESYGNFEG